MSKKIVLVSCVKTKRDVASPACELYTSDLFKKASRYARQIADEWYILSAKHGLLDPEAVIEPYEKTLNKMPAGERRAWARGVMEELREIVHPGDEVVFLAGQRYRENLVTPLRGMGCGVKIPMEGLSFGQQLRWLKEHGRSAGE